MVEAGSSTSIVTGDYITLLLGFEVVTAGTPKAQLVHAVFLLPSYVPCWVRSAPNRAARGSDAVLALSSDHSTTDAAADGNLGQSAVSVGQ